MGALGGATRYKSEVHTDSSSVAVGAAWSNLRLILDGLAREIGKRQSGSLDQRGPRINPVPEPLSRAMGGFGLGSRTEQKDRLYVLLLPNEHDLR